MKSSWGKIAVKYSKKVYFFSYVSQENGSPLSMVCQVLSKFIKILTYIYSCTLNLVGYMHPHLTTNKVESEGACTQYTSFAKTIRFILSKKKIKCCVVINEININAFT